MTNSVKRPSNDDVVRRFEVGVRVALEEILAGRDYARVETILRALSDEPARSSEHSVKPPHAS